MIIQQQIFINTHNYTWCLKEKWIFTVDKTEPEIKLTYPRTHNQWETERELKCMPPESQGLTVVDIHRDFLSIKNNWWYLPAIILLKKYVINFCMYLKVFSAKVALKIIWAVS